MLAFLPEPLPDQIHLIFLNHLNSSGIPIKPKSDIVDVDEKRAFWSLWALAQLEDVFSDPDPISTGSTDLCGEELVEAWPGIFKWSAYFYSFRVQVLGKDQGDTATLRQRCIIRDILIGSWCALSSSESTKEAMLKTHGVGDIIARLWIFEADEDVTGDIGTSPLYEVTTMQSLLDFIESRGDQAAWDSLLSAAGGDIERIMRITLRRLKKAMKFPRFLLEPVDGFCTFLFIARLCMSKQEAQEAFLAHGAISVCIKFLLWIASVINEESYCDEGREQFVVFIPAAFQFIWRSIETTTALPWILETINSGVLTAFVECSPLYDDFTDDNYTTFSTLITITIPKYLAYCSVIQAMDKSFLRLEKTVQFQSLRTSRAWEAFSSIAKLTSWRLGVVGQYKHMQKEVSTCESPKCYKSDVRSKFRKCAKCGWALYCSKECQTVHWKDFGHKKVCREPVKAYNGLKEDDGIMVHDWEFIQSLNICETRYNLPYLRRLASTEYPGVPLGDLSIMINYTTVPTAYHVTLRSKFMKDSANSKGITSSNHCLPGAKAKSNRDIVGVIPFSGKGPRVYAVPFKVNVWEQLDHNLDGTEARLDPTGNKIIDWMSEEAEERTKLYCGI